MAALVPLSQRSLDMRDGTCVVVTKVKLESTSDTITVSMPHSTVTAASCSRLLPAGSSACTSTQANAKTVTLVGTAGDIVYVTTLHPSKNYGSET